MLISRLEVSARFSSFDVVCSHVLSSFFLNILKFRFVDIVSTSKHFGFS